MMHHAQRRERKLLSPVAELLGVELEEEGEDLCVVDLGDGVGQEGVGSRLISR
jgi:hypothetical protein